MTDELKPVRCGCGGEAIIRKMVTAQGDIWTVECNDCRIESYYYNTEAEAVQAWNRAMGATDINVGDKERTGIMTIHEVACLLADLFDDPCACNFNGIDEWLPEKCELQDACPNPVGVACWEQYLKHRGDR